MSLVPPGYGIEDWRNQSTRLTALRQLGFQPGSVLDIGAYHGFWGGLAHHIWPAAELLLIEANEECETQLKERGFPFRIQLLAKTAAPMAYHRCTTGCGEGNGLYRENSIHPFETVTKDAKTLDEVVGDRVFDFIKLDCQGGELDIICGGEQTIHRAHVVQLEVQVQDYNEGAPRLDDVIAAMKLRGFRVYDIVDFHFNSRGMLIQTDLLFAKADSPLFKVRPLS